MKQILLVEDDLSLISGLSFAVKKAGYGLNDSQYGFVTGTNGYDALKLATNGFNTSGDTEIVIKGTVNGKEATITCTYTAK